MKTRISTRATRASGHVGRLSFSFAGRRPPAQKVTLETTTANERQSRILARSAGMQGDERSVEWSKLTDRALRRIAEKVDHYDHLAFALVCRRFREALGRVANQNVRTDLRRESLVEGRPTFSTRWYRWAYETVGQRDEECGALLARVSAFQGNKEALGYLAENVGWEERIASFCAFGGQLELLKWVRAQGCPWNERVCNAAAYACHLDILQYARKHNCPWNQFTAIHAASGGDKKILAWMKRQRCPGIDLVANEM